MKENKGKSWVELFHKRESLRGTEIVRMMKHLALSQYILNRNYQELYNVINSYEKDQSIWHVKNRPKLEALQKEFLRQLHNYLASILSLIDHTRAFCKNLDNQQFSKDNDEKIENIKNNKSAKFLKDLRNYTQHHELPSVFATVEVTKSDVDGEKEEKKFTLKIQDLLKWDNWSSLSQTFIEEHQKEIDLKTVIEEYQKLITKFYQWFYKRVVELNSEEIEELRKVESEMYKLEKGLE